MLVRVDVWVSQSWLTLVYIPMVVLFVLARCTVLKILLGTCCRTPDLLQGFKKHAGFSLPIFTFVYYHYMQVLVLSGSQSIFDLLSGEDVQMTVVVRFCKSVLHDATLFISQSINNALFCANENF